MSTIFVLIEDENLEVDLIQGIFTELPKAVEAAKTVRVRDEFNTIKIQERLLNTSYQLCTPASNLPQAGIIAVYDKNGVAIENRHVMSTDALGF